MSYIGRGQESTVRSTYTYTATTNQTIFTATYNIGYVDVYWNGFKLDPTEYTSTSGSSIVLNTGASLGDKIEIICWDAFSIADVYTTEQLGTRIVVGGGSDAVFMLNDTNVTTSYEIPAGKNAGTFGPITINNDVTVTIPNGSTWTVV